MVPGRVGLQLARLVRAAPAGKGWLHEEKFDGYRVLLSRTGVTTRIHSRGNQDWTARLQHAAHALESLRCESCVLDAELIALEADGRSSFSLLQQLFGAADADPRLRVMVFDLLFLDGQDLRPLSQIERKRALAELLAGAPSPLAATGFSIGDGPYAARLACKLGLEGIVSKALDAPYADGRGDSWLKIKCAKSDEFAIIGYTSGHGARQSLGSVLLGRPTAHGRWRYLGRVGTGFDADTIALLLRRLKPTHRPIALENRPRSAQLRGAQPLWVDPQLVVEVEFRGSTRDGLLRQASFKGVRKDRGTASLRPRTRDKARVGAASAGEIARA